MSNNLKQLAAIDEEISRIKLELLILDQNRTINAGFLGFGNQTKINRFKSLTGEVLSSMNITVTDKDSGDISQFPQIEQNLTMGKPVYAYLVQYNLKNLYIFLYIDNLGYQYVSIGVYENKIDLAAASDSKNKSNLQGGDKNLDDKAMIKHRIETAVNR